MSGLLRSALAVLATALLQAPSASGQSSSAATETRHLTLTTSSSPAKAAAGRRLMLAVDVALKPKMHVYAPDQPKDQDYMPITLHVTPAAAFRLDKPRYPPAENFFFAPLKETQHVYSKAFRIVQPIVVSRTAPAGPLAIDGTVRYQACDDAICYVPQTVPVKWRVEISR